MKMNKNLKKSKLSLNAETIKQLSNAEVGQAVGGATRTCLGCWTGPCPPTNVTCFCTGETQQASACTC